MSYNLPKTLEYSINQKIPAYGEIMLYYSEGVNIFSDKTGFNLSEYFKIVS